MAFFNKLKKNRKSFLLTPGYNFHWLQYFEQMLRTSFYLKRLKCNKNLDLHHALRKIIDHCSTFNNERFDCKESKIMSRGL